jgi:hypothetical protein
MEKFIEALGRKAWADASRELDSSSNCFGFARYVPETAAKLDDTYPEEAETFFLAFIIAVSNRTPDGRSEDSIRLAKRIIAESGLTCSNDKAAYEVGLRIRSGAMHPTVMQQACQLAFYYLDSKGYVADSIKEDDHWWRMPLI